MKRLIICILLMISLTGITACRKQEADNGIEKDTAISIAPTQAIALDAEVSPAISKEEPVNSDYIITDRLFDLGDNITGVYPKISGLSDSDKQNTINQLIEAKTMEFVNFFVEDNVTIELSYDIPWKGNKVLSLRYYMYFDMEGAAHPSNEFYTLNIDLVNGKQLRLSDILYIDDKFINIMREASTYSGPLDMGPELEDLLAYLPELDVSAFTKADDDTDYYNMHTYFTADAIGYNQGVSHAVGDYALFEVKLAEIKEYIRTDLPVWEDFKDALTSEPSGGGEAASSNEGTESEAADSKAADSKAETAYLDDKLCADNEEILFTFPLKDSRKRLTVCIEKDSKEYIVYRFGTKEKPELVFPDTTTNSWSKFVYSYYMRGGGAENEGVDLNYLTFENNGFQYRIYQEYSAVSNETEVGILVTDLTSGKETRITGVTEKAEGTLINLRDSDKITIVNE